jgi:acetyltransferase
VSVRNLEYLFNAKSIAVIGASDRPHSVGATVFRNLIGGTFTGPIWPINSRRSTVAGYRAFPSVGALPTPAELAVICTPAATVPQLVAELGAVGTKAAVVLTAGLSGVMTGDGRNLTDAMLAAARPHLLRVLGPNCFGMLVPGIGLNASFAHTDANVGDIAFVAQSGALMAAMLDWAKTHGIGFSHFISLGDAADVDCGDVLDYLASDPHTRAILLYLESVTAARKFMSAARAAARNKPVIGSGRSRRRSVESRRFAHGALAGADDVYDAAIRRAGMLRVATTLDLFDALEMLKHAKPLRGNRLAIITNGGGPGVMATDALIASNGKLAQLSDATIASLNAVLPTTWSHGNPVDIIGDAPPERYVAALKVLLDATEVDALLFIHAPTAIVASTEIAEVCAPLIRASPRNVLACWMGGDGVKAADAIFHSSGIPTYSTPEEAVRAFLQLTDYRRNQESLMQTPASVAEHFEPAAVTARRTILDAIASGRSMLTEPEAKSVLTAYAIPVVETRVATDAGNAVQAAIDLGFPVALKILSPDISHKSDVGGVMLNLQTADEVRSAAEAMQSRCAKLRPDAHLSGFTVSK